MQVELTDVTAKGLDRVTLAIHGGEILGPRRRFRKWAERTRRSLERIADAVKRHGAVVRRRHSSVDAASIERIGRRAHPRGPACDRAHHRHVGDGECRHRALSRPALQPRLAVRLAGGDALHREDHRRLRRQMPVAARRCAHHVGRQYAETDTRARAFLRSALHPRLPAGARARCRGDCLCACAIDRGAEGGRFDPAHLG